MIFVSFIENSKILLHLEMVQILQNVSFFLKKKAVVAAWSLRDHQLLEECPWDHLLCSMEVIQDPYLFFFFPICTFFPCSDKGVQLKCLRCSHAQQNFPGKMSLSEVAQSQSVCSAAKWVNFQKLRSNRSWVIKGNKLSKLNCKGHYQFLPQRKNGSCVIQAQLVVTGGVARGNWGFV